MPTKAEHISKAELNEAFADTVSRTSYLDWAVTVLYYAALHYVDSVLAVSGEHPTKHKDRHPLIRTNATLRTIHGEYRTLETLSWNARYGAMAIKPEDWKQAQDEFGPLRAHIRRHLGFK